MNDINKRLADALRMAVTQNNCDMLMTGDELRRCTTALAAYDATAAAPAGPGLHAAAYAVLARWDSPQWEWLKHGPTADLMHALRLALAAQPAEAVEQMQRTGAEMANVLFNLAQHPGRQLTAHECTLFDHLRKLWDSAPQVTGTKDQT